MPTPIPLTETVVLASCPQCWGANPRCARCLGRGKVLVDPYEPGRGEQGDTFEDLPKAIASVVNRDEFAAARADRGLEEAGHG